MNDTPKNAPQVQQYIEKLAELISIADKLQCELAERISPVSRCEMPESKAAQQTIIPATPIASILCEFCCQMEAHNERQLNAISKLEI